MEVDPVPEVTAETTAPAGPSAEERDKMNPVPKGKSRPPKPRYIEKFIPIETRGNSMTDKKGKTGMTLNLTTNYVPVTVKDKDGITLQYRLDFNPQLALRPQRFKVMRNWAESKNIPRFAYVYDGGNILYAGQDIGERLGTDFVEIVPLDGQSVELKGLRTSVLSNEDPQTMVLMNSQLNRFQEHEMQLVRVQDNCFNPREAKKPDCPIKIEIWPGFETAIGVFENRHLLMSVDPRFRIVRLETAMQCLKSTFESAKGRLGVAGAQKEATAAVVGQVVETPYNHKTYRVQAVDWEKTPNSKFVTKKDGQRSFAEYYETQYHLKITDLRQPMLVVKPSNKLLRRKGDDQICLIPEFCQMTGYTDKMRADFRTMQAVAVYTKLPPAGRKHSVEQFVHKINAHPDIKTHLQTWGIEYGNDLVKLQGRQLGNQDLFQGANKFSYPVEGPADWTRSLRSRLETPKAIPIWLVLYTGNVQVANDFCKAMQDVAGPMGVNFSAPKMQDVGSDRPDSYLNALRKLYRRDLALVLAIFPNNNKDRYDALKDLLCCSCPCPSQVILTKTTQKNARSVATKVVLQINAKLGGDIWKMTFPFTKPMMVIGIDTHRDRTTQKTVVVASGSYNRNLSLYFSAVEFANDDEDVFNCVAKAVKKCVDYFKGKCGVSPTQIFVYRDGISEGQVKNIKENELMQIKGMAEAYSTNEKILLTYILVNKRESTRFFLERGGDAQNPPSGTVVDDVVTRPWKYDFYLVSQSVREGTVAPTYYDVINNETDLAPTNLQLMTYKLCHMYFNWPGTIRVPAPVQYARKYAQLVALNLHKEADERLMEKLFYL